MKNRITSRLLTVMAFLFLFQVATAKEALQTQIPNDATSLPEQDESSSRPSDRPAEPVAGSRGQLLYENHCQGCHESVVHVSETHRAHSLRDLEYWVTRWSGVLNLSWGADEVGDVVDYLDHRYYHIGAESDQSR